MKASILTVMAKRKQSSLNIGNAILFYATFSVCISWSMFLFRKQLRILFDNIAILDRDLVLNRVRDLVNMTLPRWQSAPFAEVEAALTFLYMLGEALPVSHGNHFSGDPVSVTVLGRSLFFN